MKISGSVALGIIAVALVIVVVAGFYFTRQVTGGAIADDIHASMSKMKPGQSPVSPEQIEAAKRSAKPAQ